MKKANKSVTYSALNPSVNVAIKKTIPGWQPVVPLLILVILPVSI